MDSFYRNWLTQNKSENKKAKEILDKNSVTTSTTSTASSVSTPLTISSTTTPTSVVTGQTTTLPTNTSLAATTSRTRSTHPLPSTSTSVTTPTTYTSTSDLIYENDQLQLIIEKSNHIRQIKFRLQDHIFHMKIRVKSGVQPPLLRDILNFLEIGFNHILTNIKRL